jgi:hypothetical protein
MKYAFVIVLLSAGFGLAAVACGRGQGGQESASFTPTAVATPGTPSGGGHGPPVPQTRELTQDTTGGTPWRETTAGGATWRTPTDDKEWEIAVDQGTYYSGFSGVPFVRVTHLTTGQARVYSLSTVYNLVAGEVLLCSNRSAVLDQPGNNGEPVKCSEQNLTPDEQAVFGHVAMTGSYETHPPPPYPVPTQAGLEVPILFPTASPQASPPSGTATPTLAATPTPGVGQ